MSTQQVYVATWFKGMTPMGAKCAQAVPPSLPPVVPPKSRKIFFYEAATQDSTERNCQVVVIDDNNPVAWLCMTYLELAAFHDLCAAPSVDVARVITGADIIPVTRSLFDCPPPEAKALPVGDLEKKIADHIRSTSSSWD